MCPFAQSQNVNKNEAKMKPIYFKGNHKMYISWT